MDAIFIKVKNGKTVNLNFDKHINIDYSNINIILHAIASSTDDIFISDSYSYDADNNTIVLEKAYDLDTAPNEYVNTVFNESYNQVKLFDKSTKSKVVKKKKENIKINSNTDQSFIESCMLSNPNTFREEGFYIDNLTYKIILRNILKHKNTMIVGPTGTGKTDVVSRICHKLGIDIHIYDMGSMQDPICDLLGTYKLSNGTSSFNYSRFVEDIQKPGVILLDEISRAPLMTNNILFPCLDNRRTLYIDNADSTTHREIKVHPECVFIATANIGAEYVGTSEIDIALENRFIQVLLDYIPEEEEIKVLNIRTQIDVKNALKIVNLANKIRAGYKKNDISKGISIRETLEAAELVMDGFSVLEAVNLMFSEKFSLIKDEYDYVKAILMGC